MSWSIAVVERELPLGPIDNWLLHRNAGHVFLRVNDDEGKPILEIHGRSRPPEQGARANIEHQICIAFGTVADFLLAHPVKNGPRLYAEVLTDPKIMEERAHGRKNHEHIVHRGSQDEILCKIECGLRAVRAINEDEEIRYVFFAMSIDGGQNCYSVVAEMCDRMLGVTLKPEDMTFAAPGLQRDLEIAAPVLSAIKPNTWATLGEIVGSIRKLLPPTDACAEHTSKWLPSFGSDALRATRPSFSAGTGLAGLAA